MTLIVAFALVAISFVAAQTGGCLSPLYTGGTCACAGKPSDNKYFLTSFDDGATCACGNCWQYGPYFLADKSRFYCGAKVKICTSSKCVVAQVVDFGPNCRIDTMAGGPVIDASKKVCSDLFGTTSCGWSDRYRVTAVEVDRSTPLGPSGGNSVPQPVDNGGDSGNSSPYGSCRGVAGVCQDDSTPCGRSYMSGLCPGGSNIRCCPSGGGNSVTTRPAAVEPVNNGGSQYGNCRGVAGVCQDDSTPCGRSYMSGLCPGGSNIRCCPSGGSVQPDAGSQVPSVNSGGGVFPVASGSLTSISVNWGGSRSGGSRCHAGIDLYTRSGGRIVAIADGTVTSILRGWYTCSGGTIDAILIYHSSGPVSGKTVNYAEVSPGSYNVAVGQRVTAGQSLGSATRCGMLHMELYSGRQTSSQRWYPNGGWRGGSFSGCATNYLSTKPAALQDPRPLVRSLMPAGASFHAGTSFINDDGDESLSAAEDATQDVPDDESDVGGIVAGVVIGVLLVALLIAVVVFFVLRRRRAARDGDGFVVANAMFASAATGQTTADVGQSAIYAPDETQMSTFELPPAQTATTSIVADSTRSNATMTGSFACQLCGKTYNYAEDLAAHCQARH